MGQVNTFTFTSETETVTKTKLNNLVANLKTEFNGSVDNDNLKAGAGIVASKLNFGVTATGELIVNNSSDVAAGLGDQGTSSQVLTSAGAGSNPTWETSTVDLSSPDPIGDVTPNTGAFTTLEVTGGQIKFPASQSASGDVNTLDDYEEGTFTGTLSPSTSGSITMNTSFDILSYTKIGRLVTVTGRIRVSSVSSPVGGLELSLPFTISSLPEEADSVTGAVWYNDINTLASGGNVSIRGFGGLSVVQMDELSLTGGLISFADNMKAGSVIGVYFAFLVE